MTIKLLRRNLLQLLVMALALLLATRLGWAQAPATPPATATATAAAAAAKPAPSAYDRIWKHVELYNNEKNPTVQNFLFTGRLQYDYAASDADQGSNDEWNLRRL